jgi:hypothetical protein
MRDPCCGLVYVPIDYVCSSARVVFVQGAEGYDQSVDIWSLGITCIEVRRVFENPIDTHIKCYLATRFSSQPTAVVRNVAPCDSLRTL